MIASCRFLEDELRQCSEEEGVPLADNVETLGVDLRTRVERLVAKEKTRRIKCKVRFSLGKKNKAFQKVFFWRWEAGSCFELAWCQQERGECMQCRWPLQKD